MRNIAMLGLFLLIAILATAVLAEDVVKQQSEPPKRADPALRSGAANQKPGRTDSNTNREAGPKSTGPDRGDETISSGPRSARPPIPTDPIAIAVAGLLFLSLVLNVVWAVATLRIKTEFTKLHGKIHLLSQRVSLIDQAENYGRSGAASELTETLNQHRQAFDQLAAQLGAAEQRLAANEGGIFEASTAVALAARMAAHATINHALRGAAGKNVDVDRAKAIKIVEHYEAILCANAGRVKPLIRSAFAIAEALDGRSNGHPELVTGVRGLEEDLRQFETWHLSASDRLAPLRRGSVTDRYSAYRAGEAKLGEQLDAGAISITDYVKNYSDLIEHCFPPDADGSASVEPSEHETELKQIAAEAPDFLMDWFDRLSQLQAKAAHASVDAETVASLAQLQRAAKDVLRKFDIQPEEVQIGVTTFDSRLHDPVLITQSSQYPAHTVVGLQQCGIRNLSSGDVLRRPKVIVAGVGVAS